MSRYPFTPYPNGWFRIALSEDVGPGDVLPLRYFGKDLVLFRGEDNKARVLDAHCPHLGAHMGYGGQVKGNDIACPFHDWSFNGEGDCVEIPYCEKIPKKAKIKPWHVLEKNGLIFVHYHAEDKAPSFELPTVAEVDNPKWSRFVKLNWKIKVHIQEVAENALDLPHFEKVHAYQNIPSMSQFDIVDHTFKIGLRATRRVMGITGNSDMEITYHGLGVVHAKIKTMPISLRVILTTTPVDAEYVEVNMAIVFNKTWNPVRNFLVRRYLPVEIKKDFGHDIPLWENKLYFERPVLCKDDGPIMKIRRWAQQFYSAEQADTPTRNVPEPIVLHPATNPLLAIVN